MDNKTSIQIVQEFAAQHHLTILGALYRLDELVHDDWFESLEGTYKRAIPNATPDQTRALRAFTHNRKQWIKTAKELGANLQGFDNV